jgi:hypothetical protein
MPTKADFEELTVNTTSTSETLNGVNGIRLTSNTNGNSIFIPAAGSCYDGSVYDVGASGFLWGSSLNESNPKGGWGLSLFSGSVYMNVGIRYNGFTVRPVKSIN